MHEQSDTTTRINMKTRRKTQKQKTIKHSKKYKNVLKSKTKNHKTFKTNTKNVVNTSFYSKFLIIFTILHINYENNTHENNNKKVFITMEIESFTGLRLNQPVYGFINKSSHATKTPSECI